MRRVVSTLMTLMTLLSLVLVVNTSSAGAHQSGDGDGSFKHIFYIMMENHATDEIFGNTADAPYINELASKYAVSTRYFGVTHPSLPNYLAAISGDFQGIWDDCKAGADVTCAPEEFGPDSGYTNGKQLLTADEIASATKTPHLFNDKTLVDQLEGHGLSWKAYMQAMPYAGYTGEYYPVDQVNGQSVPRKLYAQKHNPFLYFSGIRNNENRLEKVVPFTDFATDLATNHVPNFVWISPDQCHDMHGLSGANAQAVGLPDCAYPATGLDHSVIRLGDDYLKQTIAQIEASKAWQEKSAIVITWDENDYSGYNGCCHSPKGVDGVTLGGANAPFLTLLSKDVDHFVETKSPYNHYSLLATIEQLWGLGCLKNACGFRGHQLMTEFFV